MLFLPEARNHSSASNGCNFADSDPSHTETDRSVIYHFAATPADPDPWPRCPMRVLSTSQLRLLHLVCARPRQDTDSSPSQPRRLQFAPCTLQHTVPKVDEILRGSVQSPVRRRAGPPRDAPSLDSIMARHSNRVVMMRGTVRRELTCQ